MIGDDDSCQELVGTKSDEHRACEKNNLMKMKSWRILEKVMKHIKVEVVE